MKLTALLLALLLAAPLTACGNAQGTSENTTAAPAVTQAPETGIVQKNGSLTLMEGEESLFTIIRAEDAPQYEVEAAQAFGAGIEVCNGGKRMKMGTDYLKKGEEPDPAALEILIGNTNRPESQALIESLPPQTFGIRTTDTKIVIAAADPINLARAVEAFFASAPLTLDETTGRLSLNLEMEHISQPYDYFAEIIPTADTLSSTAEKLLTVKAPDDKSKTVQGGYTDGKYHYQAFIQKDTASNEQNNVDVIVKTDLATGEVVKTSGPLPLNHANDITYNPKIDKLVVVHNNPNRTKVSYVDPETLEMTETVTIPYSIYSIHYSETYDRYVVGLSGGQSFTFLDGNLKRISGTTAAKPTPRTTGYTTQGVTADDNYIYFVLYNQNVITVYDWDFNFVTLIEMDLGKVEPENLSIVGNDLYVVTTGGGAAIWRVTPTAKTN